MITKTKEEKAKLNRGQKLLIHVPHLMLMNETDLSVKITNYEGMETTWAKRLKQKLATLFGKHDPI